MKVRSYLDEIIEAIDANMEDNVNKKSEEKEGEGELSPFKEISSVPIGIYIKKVIRDFFRDLEK